LHICYPYFSDFIQATKNYISLYKPRLIIIHSTIPVGYTKKINKNVVHSPIRGKYSHLDKGIRNFVKYFEGPKTKKAAKYFSQIEIPTRVFDEAEAAELLKILDTTYYSWNIVFAKEVKRICDKLHLNFEQAYTIPIKRIRNRWFKLCLNPFYCRELC